MQPYEDLFNAVMNATDPIDSNRPLHQMFQLKPSKKVKTQTSTTNGFSILSIKTSRFQLYPEYYEVIDTPIDLKMIAIRIQEGAYNSLSDMERDLLLMCRNACQFNEPGSQIYKDAKLLKKIIANAIKKQECGSISTRIGSNSMRNKRGGRNTAHSLVAQTALLRDEDDESDDEDDEDSDETINPQWQLFQTIRTAPNNQGQ